MLLERTLLYREIARLLVAIENCRKANNLEWLGKHTDKLNALVKEHMPSGSGFDCGTEFDEGHSTADRLVFNTSFHHMDEAGGYDGWTEHKVVVTPSLSFGFNIRVTGCDRNDIKDYIAETFDNALRQEPLVKAE